MKSYKIKMNTSHHHFELGTQVKVSRKGKHSIAYTGKFLNLDDKATWWYINMEDLEPND